MFTRYCHWSHDPAMPRFASDVLLSDFMAIKFLSASSISVMPI